MARASQAMRQRAFVAARRRVQTLNNARVLKGRFKDAPAPRVARVVADSLVAIDGTVYGATVTHAGSGQIFVTNAGRPAAARYVQVSESGEVKI